MRCVESASGAADRARRFSSPGASVPPFCGSGAPNPRPLPALGLGLLIHQSSRCGGSWGTPGSQPAALRPPVHPKSPQLAEGGDVTGGGDWGAEGNGVREQEPPVAMRAGSGPSSPLFVEPPHPQAPAPLRTRIFLIATPPNPCLLPLSLLSNLPPHAPENLQQV